MTAGVETGAEALDAASVKVAVGRCSRHNSGMTPVLVDPRGSLGRVLPRTGPLLTKPLVRGKLGRYLSCRPFKLAVLHQSRAEVVTVRARVVVHSDPLLAWTAAADLQRPRSE